MAGRATRHYRQAKPALEIELGCIFKKYWGGSRIFVKAQFSKKVFTRNVCVLPSKARQSPCTSTFTAAHCKCALPVIRSGYYSSAINCSGGFDFASSGDCVGLWLGVERPESGCARAIPWPLTYQSYGGRPRDFISLLYGEEQPHWGCAAELAGVY